MIREKRIAWLATAMLLVLTVIIVEVLLTWDHHIPPELVEHGSQSQTDLGSPAPGR